MKKINEKFGQMAEVLLRHRWLTIMGFLAVLAVSFWGMTKLVTQTSFDDYFIEGDPMLVKTEEFKEHFGNDYFVGILTKCDNHFTQQNLTTLRSLCNELLDSLSYVDKVTSLTDIEFMVGNEDGMSIEQIVPEEIPADGTPEMDSIRMRAYSKPNVARKLVSGNGELSWVLVKLRPFPEDSVWKKVSSVAPDIMTGNEVEKIISKPEYSSLHPMATGMPYVSAMKTVYIGEEMGRLMKIASIICLLVMLIMTRSLRGVVSPFVSVISGMMMTMGLAGWTSMYVDSTVMMMPAVLCFAVAIAYNIHIYTYFQSRMRLHGKRKEAIIETMGEIGWSVFFCGLTTIVSLLSFLVIPIRPMMCVGIVSSMSVFFVMMTSIIMTPVMLSFGRDRKPKPGINEDSDTIWSHMLVKLGDFTLNNRVKVSAIFALTCVAVGVGLFKIEPAFDIERTMGENVEYVKDVMTVGRSELGSLYSYDVVIEFPNCDEAKLPNNLQKLDLLGKEVEGYNLTKRTTSILDILKDLNQTLNNGDPAYYKVPSTEEEVAQLMILYENAGGTESEYWIDYDYKRLRLMVEISDFNSAEVERELNQLKKDAEGLFPDAKITAVGNLPQYTTMMQYLVRGQMQSFLISVLIIGLILAVSFRSVKVGLIGLIPNLMPAIFVGGYMGLSGSPLDMMTATLIPMMLGMAVDDTIHFINHSKMEFDRVKNYRLTVQKTFRVVGVAIVTTSIITSAVFSGFVGSECRMCINFGLLAIIGILSALAADLFITPILVEKFKIFGPESDKNNK